MGYKLQLLVVHHHNIVPNNSKVGKCYCTCGNDHCIDDRQGSIYFLNAGILNQVYFGHLNKSSVECFLFTFYILYHHSDSVLAALIAFSSPIVQHITCPHKNWNFWYKLYLKNQLVCYVCPNPKDCLSCAFFLQIMYWEKAYEALIK